jgi:predicted transcriptional regulator
MIAVTANAVYEADMISPAQIRAARAMIGWKQTDLASAAGISEMSIKNIERGTTDPRSSTVQAIQTALEKAGVVFLDEGVNRDGGAGIRLR